MDADNHTNEQQLYAHLRSCVEVEPPFATIERFRSLFIDGTGYWEPKIQRVLEQIAIGEGAERDFPFVLNRSCYIPVNRWQNHPQLRDSIPELVGLFETTPTGDAANSATQCLHQRVRDFTQTEHYRGLQDIAREIERKSHRRGETKPLGSLIRRYPYLYEHCWPDRNDSGNQIQQVRVLRERQQQQFDLDLSEYVLARRGPSHHRDRVTQNPTLLSDAQLDFAIDHFTSKIDGFNTYGDLARQFRSYTRQTRSYRTFKDELYEYLMTSVDRINPRYARGQFNQRLYQYLQNTLSQNDRQRLNEDLWQKTCRKLLDFLVVEHSRQPDHYVFLDLNANLGSAATIGILLKIALCCTRVKSYLEQRFAILFDRYEDAAKNSIHWLVESLEHLNVAFSLHFRQSQSLLSF